MTSSRNIKGLRQLYDKVESQVRCLKSLGVDSASYGTLLTSILTSKIPHDLSLIISREVPQDEWEFEAILKVIEREVEARERTAESYVPSKHGQEYPTDFQITPYKVLAVTVARVMCFLSVGM